MLTKFKAVLEFTSNMPPICLLKASALPGAKIFYSCTAPETMGGEHTSYLTIQKCIRRLMCFPFIPHEHLPSLYTNMIPFDIPESPVPRYKLFSISSLIPSRNNSITFLQLYIYSMFYCHYCLKINI